MVWCGGFCSCSGFSGFFSYANSLNESRLFGNIFPDDELNAAFLGVSVSTCCIFFPLIFFLFFHPMYYKWEVESQFMMLHSEVFLAQPCRFRDLNFGASCRG